LDRCSEQSVTILLCRPLLGVLEEARIICWSSATVDMPCSRARSMRTIIVSWRSLISSILRSSSLALAFSTSARGADQLGLQGVEGLDRLPAPGQLGEALPDGPALDLGGDAATDEAEDQRDEVLVEAAEDGVAQLHAVQDVGVVYSVTSPSGALSCAVMWLTNSRATGPPPSGSGT
jgi:hypothetical protein